MTRDTEKAWSEHAADWPLTSSRESFNAGFAARDGEVAALQARLAEAEAVIQKVREHASAAANIGHPAPHDGFEEGLDHGAAIHAEADLRILASYQSGGQR